MSLRPPEPPPSGPAGGRLGAAVRMAAAALVAFVAGASLAGCGLVELDSGGADGDETSADGNGTTADGSGAAPDPTEAPDGGATTAPAPPLEEPFVGIADRTTMTAEARAVLGRAEPVLVDRSGLGDGCTLDTELSVLGCYRDGEIAVLDVTDPRLDGMTETTTAHEMLHAAWIDLEDAQREQLTGLLLAAYERVADDELTERIDAYRERDPESVANELHSILGTEVGDIGSELEAYYAQWFGDRRAVVDLADGARRTFADLQDQVEELDARLAELRSEIEDEEAELEEERSAIQTQADGLDQLRDDGRIDDYNAGVAPFNERVDSYNQAVIDHQALVDEHNGLVTERNDLAAAYTDLVDQVTTTAESMPGGG